MPVLEDSENSILTFDIKKYAFNNNALGSLTFDQSAPLLRKIQGMFKEFRDLGYKEYLTEGEISNLDSHEQQFKEYLDRLRNFTIEQPDAKGVHDAYEQEVKNFYNSLLATFRTPLVYLRQEVALKSQDSQALQKQQKIASQATTQAEEMLVQLQQKLDELDKRDKQLGNTSGKVGARALGIHFNNETNKYQEKADRWFLAVVAGYGLLVLIIIVIIVYYTFYKNDGWSALSWQEGVSKLVLFTALWYGLSFILRNYNINSHLAATNRHRAAVARTLEDFLETHTSTTKDILKNGTEAMFKNAAIGYITKAEKETGSPLLEIINKIVNPKT